MKAKFPGPFGRLALLSIVLATSSTLLEAQAQVAFSASIEVQSVSDFYTPLASYGTWYNLPAYGRCWHPVGVAAVWRPYSIGHWEWTDCGWYWGSDEPFAWACYHYGSWAYDPVYGWVWIPRTEWAPAWVVWRKSPDYDYIGWAPCGPSGVVLAPSLFVFVDVHHFRDGLRPERLIVNNTAIINRTRVVNNITEEIRLFNGRKQRIAVNRGPGIDPIQHSTGSRIAPRPIEQVVAQTPNPEATRRGRAPEVTQVPESRTSKLPRENGQQPAPQPASRQEQPAHIYRQPATPPTPTGREEPRIYHEPSPTVRQTAPPAVAQPPPSRQISPQEVVPHRAPPPTAREGAPSPGQEQDTRRFQNNPPRAPKTTPTPAPQAPPSHQAPPPPERGRDKEHDRG